MGVMAHHIDAHCHFNVTYPLDNSNSETPWQQGLGGPLYPGMTLTQVSPCSADTPDCFTQVSIEPLGVGNASGRFTTDLGSREHRPGMPVGDESHESKGKCNTNLTIKLTEESEAGLCMKINDDEKICYPLSPAERASALKYSNVADKTNSTVFINSTTANITFAPLETGSAPSLYGTPSFGPKSIIPWALNSNSSGEKIKITGNGAGKVIIANGYQNLKTEISKAPGVGTTKEIRSLTSATIDTPASAWEIDLVVGKKQ